MKKRKFDINRYKTRPGQARGSPDAWRQKATTLILGDAPDPSADWAALGLSEAPADIAALKRAYRSTMMMAHPDQGGTDEQAVAASLAYARLLAALKAL